ncbi:hypothetical protein [Nodularia sp. LEGE 04288]|uniref:hypothetical protein n=1 Tax=Nodularia sp. LEGE 04288 TaxID=1828639 RepID=UPI001D1299F9|nr:hypothetical protein [Nodularia sp. LEGE 04288]MCC2693914.1 hypothetical protein [Nodularia sp. LEGE 04288]
MRQVVRQIQERIKFEFELEGIKYELWRLDDYEYRKIQKNSLAIKDDSSFYNDIYLSEDKNKSNLDLAKSFITLTWLFGNSSDLVDSYKSSFSFPLLLTINKAIGSFLYLLHIFDSKGWIYYRLYKVFEDESDIPDKIQNEIFESELTRQEINNFLNYIHTYINASFNSLNSVTVPEPFLKAIDASCMIYGYHNNQYIEEEYNDEQSYQAALERFRLVGLWPWQPQNINALLQTITSKTFRV